jgi:hypothetical protein
VSRLLVPEAYGFVGQVDAAFRHELFAVARAETEAEVQLNRMTDDLPRETMALIRAVRPGRM